jgi:Domain of unknown function (DUF6984)
MERPMSESSESASSLPTRPLREEEIELIASLIRRIASSETLKGALKSLRVRGMKDGNMGSIRFARDERRIFDRVLAEAQYTDADGVCVSIAINGDDKGDLFEVDFWKVDFSPLKRYPKPSDLRVDACPTSDL